MLEVTLTYDSVDEGLVIISMIDFENDTHLDEIVDVDVFEKRRRGGLGPDRSNKRTRLSEDSGTFTGPSQPSQSRQPFVEDIDDEDDLPVQPFHRQLPPASTTPIPSHVPLPQFHSQGPIPFAPVPTVPIA